MKIYHLLRLGAFVAADKRLERKEIDLRKLEKEYEEEDDMELEDLDMWDERKPKQGMDTRKLDGRDHITTWSEAKKGQQLGMYVNTVPGKIPRKKVRLLTLAGKSTSKMVSLLFDWL